MNASLVGSYFENRLCEHCRQTHEVWVEIWSWKGVSLTRYQAKCQAKPVYGFAH